MMVDSLLKRKGHNMAIEQKERYVVEMIDGTRKTCVLSSFQEVLALFGEENVTKIEKLDYEEVK